MNKHEQWQLTAEAAELYERFVVRYILGPWAPLLVDTARLAAGEHVSRHRLVPRSNGLSVARSIFD